MKKLILFLLLVVPGCTVIAASVWWGINDFTALVNANNCFQERATQEATHRELFILAHQAEHPSDQCWL